MLMLMLMLMIMIAFDVDVDDGHVDVDVDDGHVDDCHVNIFNNTLIRGLLCSCTFRWIVCKRPL